MRLLILLLFHILLIEGLGEKERGFVQLLNNPIIDRLIVSEDLLFLHHEGLGW